MKKVQSKTGYEGLSREELLGLLRQRDREIRRKDREIEALKEKVAELARANLAKNEQLMLKRYNDYQSKSDSPRPGGAAARPAGKGAKRGRRPGPLPSREELERIWDEQGRRTVTIEPKGLPEGAERFAEDFTYKVERVPGEYVVVRVVRPKYRHGGGVLQAPADPADPFPHSPATPSLAASAAALKFLLGVPVDRQAKRMPPVPGLSSPQALGGVLARAASALEPIVGALEAEMRSSPSPANVDETPIRVLEKYKSGGRNGYIFVCVRDVGGLPAVGYSYSDTRAPDGAMATYFPKGARLVVDGYSGYGRIAAESGESITLQRCIAHLRRRFTDCLKSTPAEQRATHPATPVVEEIAELYRLEAGLAGTAEERLALRRGREYLSHVESLRSLIGAIKADEGTALARAKGYFENGGEDFFSFLGDGELPLDNNRAERAVKPFVLARRNFLFVENGVGGRNAATLMTLIENAVLRGLDAERYLRWALENVGRMDPDRLLPWSKDVPAEIRLKVRTPNM